HGFNSAGAFGDVAARTEHADDVSHRVSAEGMAPINQAFFAGSGQNRFLASAGFVPQPIAKRATADIAQPLRQAGVKPVTSEEFDFAPSKQLAALSVNQRNAS